MKSLKLSPGPIPSKISVPGSKSYANRALILASLSPNIFTLHDLPESTDVLFLVEALRQIGLEIEASATSLTVKGHFPACESADVEIVVGEGGTTARFLASLLLKGKARYTLILGDRLKARPWQEFIDLVNVHGGRADMQDHRLTIQGPVSFPHELAVDCARTTQFASGIQLAYPEIEVVPLNLKSSESYWKMTSQLQKKMKDSASFPIPLDWSSASYPLAFGALNQEIFFPDLQDDEFQSDAKFLHLLRTLGLVEEMPSGVRVFPAKIEKDIEMDVSDALDLVPALSFFLAHIKGRHQLHGIENLQHKESNRLFEVIKLLNIFERSASTSSNTLIIEGHNIKIKTPVDLVFPDDHRMVMTGALFLRQHSGGSLFPDSAVSKSYPRFFDLLQGLSAP